MPIMDSLVIVYRVVEYSGHMSCGHLLTLLAGQEGLFPRLMMTRG